jgi:hypothetical protein
MAIDYKSIIIPTELQHILRINGNALLLSVFASASERECCQIPVAYHRGCINCGERYLRIGRVTASRQYNDEWYLCHLEFCGVFRNCHCDASKKLDHISIANPIHKILFYEKDRILKGNITQEEAAWRYKNNLLSAEEIKALHVRGFIPNIEINRLSDIRKIDKKLTPEDLPF